MPKPTKFVVLAEFSAGNKTAILERYRTPYGQRYRVTAAERFDKLADAKAALAQEFPEDQRHKLTDKLDSIRAK